MIKNEYAPAHGHPEFKALQEQIDDHHHTEFGLLQEEIDDLQGQINLLLEIIDKHVTQCHIVVAHESGVAYK